MLELSNPPVRSIDQGVVSGFRDSDLGISGRYPSFGSCDIRASFEQLEGMLTGMFGGGAVSGKRWKAELRRRFPIRIATVCSYCARELRHRLLAREWFRVEF